MGKKKEPLLKPQLEQDGTLKMCPAGVRKRASREGKRTQLTDEQKEAAKVLRIAGESYRDIAKATDMGVSSAKRICDEVDDLEEFRRERRKEIIILGSEATIKGLQLLDAWLSDPPEGTNLGHAARATEATARIAAHAAGEVTPEKPLPPEINMGQVVQQIMVFQQRANALEAQNTADEEASNDPEK